MKIESLRDLFEFELRCAYDCEQRLVKKGLPSIIEAASSPELRSAFEQHLQETRGQVTRLQRVFASINSEAKTETNDALDELTSATKDLIEDIESPELRDAALILSANKVEHYEMALYGSLVAFAQELGFQDAASLLQQNLQEEKTADAKLTQLGESSINSRAQQLRAA